MWKNAQLQNGPTRFFAYFNGNREGVQEYDGMGEIRGAKGWPIALCVIEEDWGDTISYDGPPPKLPSKTVWFWKAAIVDAVVCILILATVASACEWWIRRKAVQPNSAA